MYTTAAGLGPAPHPYVIFKAESNRSPIPIMFTSIRRYYQNLLPGLRDDDWKALEEKLTVQQIKKGGFLVRQGEVCRQVSYINKGLVRTYYTADGKDVSTGFMCEGEYTSQYDSFLLQQPSAGNIDALEDAEIINLSYADMQGLYRSHPAFEVFGRKIAEMLFIMVSLQTTRLLTLTPEERYNSVVRQQPFIVQRVPQYMIASFIGITPEHLSRLRRKISGRE